MSATANITFNLDASNASLLQALAPLILPDLAKEIVRELKREGLVMTPPPPDALIEVSDIRMIFGKRGRPRSYGWFKRNYIDTGLLELVDHPDNRAKQYVSRAKFMEITKGAAAPPSVIKLEAGI